MSEARELMKLLQQALTAGKPGGGGGDVSSSGTPSGLQQIGLNAMKRAGRRSAPLTLSDFGLETDVSMRVRIPGYQLPAGCKLRVKLGGAAGTPVVILGSYVVSKGNRILDRIAIKKTVNSTTEVDIVPAATGGHVHTLDAFTAFNNDGSTQTITLEARDSATWGQWQQIVPSKETFFLQDGGWYVTHRGQPIPVSGGGTGLATVPSGALLYGQGANPLATLALGSASQFLQSNGTNPIWVSMSGDGSLSAGVLTISQAGGAFALPGVISPSISADQNDWNPTSLSTASRIRVTATGALRNITGLQGGSNGRLMIIHNIGSLPVVLKHNATGSSTAGNCFSIGSDITLFTGDSVVLAYDGTDSRWRCAAKHVAVPYLLYQDQKATSTDGGTFTSGAWRTRTLNTEVHDDYGLGALASNQVTLQPGTYLFRGVATAIGVDRHQVKLYNATDATDIQLGTSEFTSSTDATVNTCSTVVGKFTITAAKAIELQHRCSTTRSTDGFGVGLTWGTNIFASLEFWRVP